MSNNTVSRKLAVVGARAVGKSSLTLRFTEARFDDMYYPTIANQFLKSFKINGKTYAVDIADTSGQDEFLMMDQRALIGVHGFLLVYSVSSRSSFEVLRTIRAKILDMLSFGDETKVPFTVIGNKTDLPRNQHVITKEEGQALAKEFHCPFLEVSAKDNINVEKGFEVLLVHIDEVLYPQEKKDGCVIV